MAEGRRGPPTAASPLQPATAVNSPIYLLADMTVLTCGYGAKRGQAAVSDPTAA